MVLEWFVGFMFRFDFSLLVVLGFFCMNFGFSCFLR